MVISIAGDNIFVEHETRFLALTATTATAKWKVSSLVESQTSVLKIDTTADGTVTPGQQFRQLFKHVALNPTGRLAGNSFQQHADKYLVCHKSIAGKQLVGPPHNSFKFYFLLSECLSSCSPWRMLENNAKDSCAST